MAEKIRDGISRELRYVEYKLRKKRSDKNKKRIQDPQAGPSAPSIPEVYKEVAPSNHGEEDLQLQVALAMSREEAKESEKSELSDKIRLEMALKESAEVAEKVMAKHSPAHAQATESKHSIANPWGAPLASSQKNAFDPFAAAEQKTESGFADNTWGSAEPPGEPIYAVPFTLKNKQSVQVSNSITVDPWSASFSTGTNQIEQSSGDISDPWKASNIPNAPIGQSSNSSLFLNTQNQSNNDPWGGSQNPSVPASVLSDPWGSSPTISQGNVVKNIPSESFDPFNAQAFTPSQNLDSLKGFDQLAINPTTSSLSAPAMSHGLFSSDVMTPQPVGANQTQLDSSFPIGDAPNVNETNVKADAFLGTSANLVNIDSLLSKPTTTHQFITMNPTSGSLGSNRNPFNQKGPSLSLNQMKPDNQNPFAQTSSGFNSASATGLQPSAMSLPPMGLTGAAPPQSNYVMATGLQQNNLNPFNPQSAAAAAAASYQSTQSLI